MYKKSIPFSPINRISVVIPVYNEQESLPALLERTSAACKLLNRDYEIVLVDDGSSDDSAAMILEAAEKADSRVVAVLLNRNYGQHSAVMAGLAQADGDLVITMDADLQNPPEEIPNLAAKADEGYDVVGAVRVNRKDTLFRKTASRLINKFVRGATGKAMSDYGCMLRAYRRHIVDAMLKCHERSTFIPILANTFARRTVEINVAHAEREFGVSKYGIFKLIHLMFDLVTCLTTTPLRMFSILGSLVAASGVLLAVIIVIFRFIFGPDWGAEGVFSLFAILFIFIGVQFLGLGILGEYIGRMYADVRARPRYFIQQVVDKTASARKKENLKEENNLSV